MQKQYAPSVDGVAGDVHEGAGSRQYPYRRGFEYLFLDLLHGSVGLGPGLFMRQSLDRRQSFGFRGVVEPAEDDDYPDGSRRRRSEKAGLPSGEGHDRPYEEE